MTPAPAVAAAPSKKLNIALWIAQGWLGFSFLLGGSFRAFSPMSTLIEKIPWASAISEPMMRFIAITEMIGAVGLLLPSITRIMPRLTPLAALGLAVIMGL